MLCHGISCSSTAILFKPPRWWRGAGGVVGDVSFFNKWWLFLWNCRFLLLLHLSPLARCGSVKRRLVPATLCSERGGGGINELIYVGGESASMTFCRYGGISATSGEEALLRSRGGCSKLPGGEVICSPQLGGGPRRKIYAGRGPSSIWFLLLGGDAWRTPAFCSGGT
jgi:hypothetical protein